MLLQDIQQGTGVRITTPAKSRSHPGTPTAKVLASKCLSMSKRATAWQLHISRHTEATDLWGWQVKHGDEVQAAVLGDRLDLAGGLAGCTLGRAGCVTGCALGLASCIVS